MKVINVLTGEATTAPDPDPVYSTAELLERERADMVCSRFQAKDALRAAGLLSAAQAVVDAADETTQLAWVDANVFERNSPTIAALAAAVGLTDSEIDDLFRAAMQIEA